ncbi:MAG: hypothetical protein SVK08_02010 [Halobacteriota archaeon]|nr:hypothetical protein [Halobacteriota archaeon]
MPESRLNPDIAKADVGVRELKTVTIYPLSAAFQMNLAGGISDLLVNFFSVRVKDLSEDEVSQKIAGLFMELIRENIETVLGHVIDSNEMTANGFATVKDLLEDVTNNQLLHIGQIVYDNNYKELVAKLKGFLMERVKEVQDQGLDEVIQKKASAMKSVSPSSADTTEPTESETSTNRTGEEE